MENYPRADIKLHLDRKRGVLQLREIRLVADLMQNNWNNLNYQRRCYFHWNHTRYENLTCMYVF